MSGLESCRRRWATPPRTSVGQKGSGRRRARAASSRPGRRWKPGAPSCGACGAVVVVVRPQGVVAGHKSSVHKVHRHPRGGLVGREVVHGLRVRVLHEVGGAAVPELL